MISEFKVGVQRTLVLNPHPSGQTKACSISKPHFQVEYVLITFSALQVKLRTCWLRVWWTVWPGWCWSMPSTLKVAGTKSSRRAPQETQSSNSTRYTIRSYSHQMKGLKQESIYLSSEFMKKRNSQNLRVCFIVISYKMWITLNSVADILFFCGGVEAGIFLLTALMYYFYSPKVNDLIVNIHDPTYNMTNRLENRLEYDWDSHTSRLRAMFLFAHVRLWPHTPVMSSCPDYNYIPLHGQQISHVHFPLVLLKPCLFFFRMIPRKWRWCNRRLSSL